MSSVYYTLSFPSRYFIDFQDLWKVNSTNFATLPTLLNDLQSRLSISAERHHSDALVQTKMNFPIHCMACRQSACSGDCLETHRNEYGCHNPHCFYHRPCPREIELDSDDEESKPQPEPEPESERNTVSSDAATTATATSSTGAVAGSSATITTRRTVDEDLGHIVYRETITREYFRLADGQIVQIPRGPSPRVTVAQPLPVGPATAPAAGSGVSSQLISLNEIVNAIREFQIHERRIADLERSQQHSSDTTTQTSSNWQSPSSGGQSSDGGQPGNGRGGGNAPGTPG